MIYGLIVGVTEECVNKILIYMQNHGTEIELHALLNETARLSPNRSPYRGYCLLNCNEKAEAVQVIGILFSLAICLLGYFSCFCCL